MIIKSEKKLVPAIRGAATRLQKERLVLVILDDTEYKQFIEGRTCASINNLVEADPMRFNAQVQNPPLKGIFLLSRVQGRSTDVICSKT